MKHLTMILTFLAIFLFACTPGVTEPEQVRAVSLEDCVLPTVNGDQVDALCGSFSVAENPADPQGRQIPLRIALIPALKRVPQPDPLFLLAGGPGQSAIEAYPALFPAFYSVHEDRDIVMVDQRGTGKSNPLRCLDPDEESLDGRQSLELLKSCPDHLDADARFYTTEIAMSDLDAVRAALGYRTINLYGASYGTRAALTYLRLYPDNVRTVTLDAVVDPEFVLFMDAAQDGQRSLDLFFGRCQADQVCNETFPALENEFEALLSRLESDPVEMSMRHPLTAESLELTLTPDVLTSIIFSTLYSPDLLATLPLSIHTAYEEANYVPLVSQGYMLDAGIYDGMFYAVACNEDAPYIQPEQAARRSSNTIFGDLTVDFLEVCATWPKADISPDFRAPVTSDVPVLILSGEADPITPPWHAEQAAKNLSNSLHLIFTGMGHSNLANQCGVDLLTNFIESASLDGLDVSCVSSIKPPPFFINFSGPRP